MCGVLLDHLVHVSALPVPNLTLVTALLPQFTQLCQVYPIPAAEAFVAKLKLMHKNFARGLSHGPTLVDSRTWPGSAELVLLRLVGTIWPTSDKAHVVIGPARLLMASFLGLARVRSLEDIASGLYLSTLVLRFERLSQRLVPEVVNFLFNTVVHLAPHSIKNPSTLPGTFPTPDFGETHCPSLKLSKKAKSLSPRKADLAALLSDDNKNDEQVKVDLLACTLDVLGRFADLYKGLDGFIELFTPLQPLLAAVNAQQYSPELKVSLTFDISNHKPLTQSITASTRRARRPADTPSQVLIASSSASAPPSAQSHRHCFVHPQVQHQRWEQLDVLADPGSRPRACRGGQAASRVPRGTQGCDQRASQGRQVYGRGGAQAADGEGPLVQRSNEAGTRFDRGRACGREGDGEGKVEDQETGGQAMSSKMWIQYTPTLQTSNATYIHETV